MRVQVTTGVSEHAWVVMGIDDCLDTDQTIPTDPRGHVFNQEWWMFFAKMGITAGDLWINDEQMTFATAKLFPVITAGWCGLMWY